MRIHRVVACCAAVLALSLCSVSRADADPVFRITMEGNLVGFEGSTFEVDGPFRFTFDITAVVLPGADGGRFRFDILRWTRPLSYNEDMLESYWTEEMAPYPGSLTGMWDPVRGSSIVQAEMVHGGAGRFIDRSLFSGEPNIYIPQAELDPVFHLIPMSLHSWENATGPWGPNNYFGSATVTDVAPVPEPATIGLLVVGLASAGLRRRRRAGRY